jgi:hypothetical protein
MRLALSIVIVGLLAAVSHGDPLQWQKAWS